MKLVTLFKKIAPAISLFILSAFLVSQAPQVHRDFLRIRVGSKTVQTFIPDPQGRVDELGEPLGFQATGFYIKAPESKKTYVITNNHVCERSNNGKVGIKHRGESKLTNTKILKTQFLPDLCLLGPIKKKIVGLSLATNVRIGEMVALLGFPGGAPLTLTMGEITDLSSLSHLAKYNISKEECKKMNKNSLYKSIDMSNPMAVFQAMMNGGIVSACAVPTRSVRMAVMGFPGNSGSAVVNFYGNVVGIHYAMSNDGRLDDQFVVKIEQIKEFLKGY